MRFAIVGTNFISDNFCDAVSRLDNAEITAVYSRSQDTGTAFAARHGIPRAFTDYTELISCSDVDAVYIASPTVCHATHAVRAMRAGKQVLVEKMMGAELADFLWMKQVARETGRVMLEAMRPAHDPVYEVIKSALPRLGRLRRASLEFCQYSRRYDRFKNGELTNAFDPKMKNSALSDIGIYPLHAALSLFGVPDSLTGSSVFLDNGFEGAGVITLSYPDMIATVTYSKISESTTPSVIEGELGSLLIDKISAPTSVILKLRGKEAEPLAVNPAENNMIYEISAFIDMCENRRDPTFYLDLTEKAQRIVEKIYVSSGIYDRF